uniref:Uncharacterized protein n=1 Tax=Neobodo designis TaxID=312471 RepID=A0A7S1MJ41_NEODS|mmetsp:Transcript_4149/g.13189  ORF Transcript_4149/g.13189 Transcript_4149/m.13189 type:complete len:468 (+) Transcript_4149:32-1435(+)|eukprot:CAMPEP_0174839776 /NCGR_PEP_ID=MMETSP1114-20130205/8264_1 /TAXON_ID=312471 /ORGANISM="Neobodo designis, Strain CCAP 1951/1" /LENGTH=467 /DNA_ID=CAMNT_0016073903 /DNA_START=30 /DNA_END=1433 /DNA_ORIENTATION=+
MSDYDDDFENVESPQKEGQPSWLHPLNKRAASDSEPSSSHHTPKSTPTASEESIPPTPPSERASGIPRTPSSHRSSARASPLPPTSSDDGYSNAEDEVPGPAAPSWADVKPPKHAPSTSHEIAELRKRNAELQAAVSAVKEQLAKVAPKLDAGVKRKHSAENERMNRLQEEAATLRAEHARLTKKLKDVDQVTALEKQLRDRQQELKVLHDRNKSLQIEIRNNAKKLKQMASIEEQRAKMLAAIKQEQKVAQNAVKKAERDAELAVQARDGAAERLRALELKDKVPELKPEDVRVLIEMKQTLVSKQETIEALQYRLSVLKRAHESAQRHLVAEPTDTNEIESLRAEVIALRSKLEAGRSNAPTGSATDPTSSQRTAPPDDERQMSVSAHSSTPPGDASGEPQATTLPAASASSREASRQPSPAQTSSASSPTVASPPASDSGDRRDQKDANTPTDGNASEPEWLDE